MGIMPLFGNGVKLKTEKNGYVLLEVVRTFEDYIKAKGLDEYF